MEPSVTEAALYWNPLRVWSPLLTAGKATAAASTELPAVSETVTVTLAVLVLAAVGVPLIAPVDGSMLSPGGRPVALYSSMPPPPFGCIAVIATPTCSEGGAAQVGAVGAVRSTFNVRVTSSGAV